MSDLEPRRPASISRRDRADRAYKLVLATGGLAALTVVLLVLSIVAGFGGGLWIITLIAAAVSGLLLRRTLNP